MNNPTITHIICTHGEPQVFELIDLLKSYKHSQDKIWILNDPTTPEYEKQLKAQGVNVVNHILNKDYGEHRNYILERVKTDYFWFHDADEQPTLKLLKGIKEIITNTHKPDVIWLPRKNIFSGFKPIDALMYGWTVKDGLINYPDYQGRIGRVRRDIRYSGVLHEQIKTDPKLHNVIHLPMYQDNDIIHVKSMTKQHQDNARYLKDYTPEQNRGQH